MIESDQDPNVERFARAARRPVHLADGARARLMAAVHAAPAPGRQGRAIAWLVSPRTFASSPAASSLLAAGLVGIGILIGVAAAHRVGRPLAEPLGAVAARTQLPVHDTVLTMMQFVVSAPAATHVSLVGDFNGWSTAATPMTRVSNGTKWTVSLPLEPGQHAYAFVVDGKKWVPDPSALQAPDDGFGERSSIVIVRRGTSM